MAEGTNPKIFYGYIVATVSVFILVVMHGIGNTYGIFFKSLQNEFATNRATIAGASSLAVFLEGLFGIFFGRLTDRFGPRKVLTACGFIFGLGYFLMSQVGAVWQLYLFYAIAVGIGISSGNVALLSTIARWFVKRRGLMSGMVKVGTGAGMFILPPVATWLILNYGWRNAYLALAIVGVVSIVILAQFLRHDPVQMGLKPYGMSNTNHVSSELVTSVQLTTEEAIRTRQFWLICVAYFTVIYTTASILIHIVAYATDGGISAGSAASIVSVIGAISILGRLVMGGTGDRIGNKRTLFLCFVILIVALSWLQFTKELWMLYLFAIVYGFAHGGFFAVMSPLVAEVFGTLSHGANFGMVLFLGQTGGALGPLVTGLIFDVTQSYQLAFLILFVSSIGGLILASMLKPININK
ncbi:MFS transporter [Chloroflexota bacterium]